VFSHGDELKLPVPFWYFLEPMKSQVLHWYLEARHSRAWKNKIRIVFPVGWKLTPPVGYGCMCSQLSSKGDTVQELKECDIEDTQYSKTRVDMPSGSP
jgi:hypothetical protein